jgi:hypothetical protein
MAPGAAAAGGEGGGMSAAAGHMERLRAHRRSRKGTESAPAGRGAGNVGHPIDVPADVLAAREARAAAPPRDLTGALQGDPPAAFSELDRRGAAA